MPKIKLARISSTIPAAPEIYRKSMQQREKFHKLSFHMPPLFSLSVCIAPMVARRFGLGGGVRKLPPIPGPPNDALRWIS